MSHGFNKWDHRFLKMSLLVAQWSKDDRKVGAVIANGKHMVSPGYNGPPARTSDQLTREQRHLRTLHAELNAILAAAGNTQGHTLYCTHPPCAHCMAVIIQVGISRVVAINQPLSDRWQDSVVEAEIMAAEAGVLYRTIQPEQIK